jgi:MFS family permease
LTIAARNNSIASQSANIQQRANQINGQVAAEQGWLESKFKPKKITTRYPIKGKVLLFATCGFGSLVMRYLGTTLVGPCTSSHKRNSTDIAGIMSGLLVDPVFVKRFFSDFGGANGSTAAVNPSITGISVACLQESAAVGALIARCLGDMIVRKRTVCLGGIIYFLSAFIQIFAPGIVTFVAG